MNNGRHQIFKFSRHLNVPSKFSDVNDVTAPRKFSVVLSVLVFYFPCVVQISMKIYIYLNLVFLG